VFDLEERNDESNASVPRSQRGRWMVGRISKTILKLQFETCRSDIFETCGCDADDEDGKKMTSHFLHPCFAAAFQRVVVVV
jgi:hypothetical protein